MGDLDEISGVSLIFAGITAVIMTILKLTIWPEYNTYNDWMFIVVMPAAAVLVIVFIFCFLWSLIDTFG